MKQYTIEIRDTKDELLHGTVNKYGNVYFEWMSEPTTLHACLQHEAQPAIFFEQLLQEAGYKKVDKLDRTPEDKGEAIKEF